jgi:DNA invertase Pin-like site-specific DNA recombinase
MPRQSGSIRSWAADRTQATGKDHRIVKITEDSVSGAVSPFARTGLGPWLRRPLLDRWRVLAVHSIDRLTRSVDDFEALRALFETERKILVSTTEDIDLSTACGLLEARRRVRLAQAELELIKRRAKAAHDAIVANGQYPGKQFPFGYIPAKREPTGWILIQHPLYSYVVREMADRFIVGESLGAICRWLNRTGIPTPRNAVREYKGNKPLIADARWMPTSLTKILMSPNIVGQIVVNGIAVKRAEPLIDVPTWEHVKQILARNAVRTGPKINSSPLLHVLFCMLCQAPMYIATASYRTASGETKKYRYYCCTAANRNRGCNARRVDADEVERYLGDRLTASIGDRPLTEDEIIPRHDNSGAIAEVAEAIGELSSQKAMATAMHLDTSGIEAQIQAREAELVRLAAEPVRPGRTIRHGAVETWTQRWARSGWDGRNRLLLDTGIRAEAARLADGTIKIEISGV